MDKWGPGPEMARVHFTTNRGLPQPINKEAVMVNLMKRPKHETQVTANRTAVLLSFPSVVSEERVNAIVSALAGHPELIQVRDYSSVHGDPCIFQP